MRGLSSTLQGRSALPTHVATAVDMGLPLPVAAGEPVRICASAKNRSQIAAAFGDAAIVAIEGVILDVLSRSLSSASHFISETLVESDLVFIEIAARLSPVDLARLIEALSQALALEPVVIGEDRIHIAPSVRLAGEPDADQAYLEGHFGGGSAAGRREWMDCYRRDMATVAQLFEDLNADRLTFALQPIRMAQAPDRLLYEEFLLRRTEGSHTVGGAGVGILAAERLGLVRVLDNYVVRSAVSLMRYDPGLRLGVNISAQSVCLDEWWTVLENELEAESDLAERLIIEITETAGFSSIIAATAFARRMGALGCRIALDDFGMGRDAIKNLYALKPNIVKVDAFFVHDARDSASGQSALKSLVGFSRAIGGAVVVEGIETKADSDAASLAGAIWQQGHFIQPPKLADHPVQEGQTGEADPLPVPSPYHLRSVFLLAVPLWALGIAVMWLVWSGIT